MMESATTAANTTIAQPTIPHNDVTTKTKDDNKNNDDKRKTARKRWKKLKWVMKATRPHSSLTKPEEEFLEAMKNQSIKKDSVTTRRGSVNSLQIELLKKSDVLTDKERAFLTNLINLPGVSDAQLEHVHQVLLHDPVYREKRASQEAKNLASALEPYDDDELHDKEEEKEDSAKAPKIVDTKPKEEEEKKETDDDSQHKLMKGLWKTFTVHADSDRNYIRYETKASTRKFESTVREKTLRKNPLLTKGINESEEEKREEDYNDEVLLMNENEVVTAFRNFFNVLQSIQDEQQQAEENKEEFEYYQESPNKKISRFFSNIFGGEKDNEDEGSQEEEKEEEVVEPEYYCILNTLGADCKHCFPHVMSPLIMDALRPHMPYTYRDDNFWLKYSMIRDGASLKSMMDNVRDSAITIIAVETLDGDIFGSFTSSLWRSRGRTYYGSCEAFLWRLKTNSQRTENTSRMTADDIDDDDMIMDQIGLESDVEIFPWSQKNRNIQSVLQHPNLTLHVGGGGPDEDEDPATSNPYSYSPSSPTKQQKTTDKNKIFGSGLILNNNLERGVSEECVTFESPCLLSSNFNDGMFKIMNVEVWTMTPVEDKEQAEQLEYGRHFVFDNAGLMDQ